MHGSNLILLIKITAATEIALLELGDSAAYDCFSDLGFNPLHPPDTFSVCHAIQMFRSRATCIKLSRI